MTGTVSKVVHAVLVGIGGLIATIVTQIATTGAISLPKALLVGALLGTVSRVLGAILATGWFSEPPVA